ncbi:MAG TPA: hypothetical protein VGP89_19110 [Candidatus Angelobacter sp.]|jgi:hypothetical protein|nr:hypothetical protein [Candidatus Angelobacter sp.]
MKKLFAVILCLASLCQAQSRYKGVMLYDQVTVTFSATPTFDASKANVFKLTLTGNVTSSTLSNALTGQDLIFELCQDGTGGRTFVAPANVQGFLAISSTASACTTQEFIFDGTNAQPLTATAVVSAISGVTFPASPSTHSVPVITAANTATWKVVPNCTDTTGNHLNYTQSTDAFSCGTSTPAVTVGPQKQIFASSGTHTIVSATEKATVCGAGGGGGGATASNNGGGGGSGGAAIKWLTGLTPGNTIAVTVGAAGTAGTTGNPGGTGGNSTIASGTQTITTVTAFGGGGGNGNGTQSTGGSGGAVATNADSPMGGNSGIDGFGISGGAGGGIFGGGGPSSNGGLAGNAATSFCAGGGGAGAGGARSGGAGAAGQVVFEWVN